MKSLGQIGVLFIFLTVNYISIDAENNSTLTSTTTSSPTRTSATAPPLTNEEQCRRANSSCEACVKITSCYYCLTSKRCEYYPYNHIFPKSKECDMGEIRWAVCWFNFKALVISLSVIGGILIISCIICICCCCRRKKKNANSRIIQQNAKMEREREERRIKNLERQKERQSKNDEIRRKYGLIKDDQPYQRFDA